MEEEIFYPEIEKYPKTESMVADALQEHDGMKLLLERAGDFPVKANEWWELIERADCSRRRVAN